MRNLTVEVFDHIDINSPMDVYQRLPYTQRIFRGAALKIIEILLYHSGSWQRNSRDMSVTLSNWRGYLRRLSGRGTIWIPRGMIYMLTLIWMSALNFRGIYGCSWVNACGESTGVSTRTT